MVCALTLLAARAALLWVLMVAMAVWANAMLAQVSPLWDAMAVWANALLAVQAALL